MNITEIYKCDITTQRELPLFLSSIRAGFPSPADDYLDKKLDLNEYLIKHPASTFFVKVNGDSMVDAGILSSDILIVARSLEPVICHRMASGIQWGSFKGSGNSANVKTKRRFPNNRF